MVSMTTTDNSHSYVLQWAGRRVFLAVSLLIVLFTVPAGAQTPIVRRVGNDSVVVVAGEIYKAGSFHRAMLGKNYRDEWTTPITVPVLDLKTAHGGLKPTKEGGGKQAPSLRFVAPDSSEWVFRMVRKIHLVLGDEYRHTIIWYVVRDEGSASHPTAAIAAAPLFAVPGLLHATPKLYYMPDDPALGEFRKTFGGVLGMLEEYPEVPKSGKAFAGVEKIIDSDTLLARLNTDPQTRIDTRALLTARLMDMFLGDNDRHPDESAAQRTAWRRGQVLQGALGGGRHPWHRRRRSADGDAGRRRTRRCRTAVGQGSAVFLASLQPRRDKRDSNLSARRQRSRDGDRNGGQQHSGTHHRWQRYQYIRRSFRGRWEKEPDKVLRCRHRQQRQIRP